MKDSGKSEKFDHRYRSIWTRIWLSPIMLAILLGALVKGWYDKFRQ